MRAEDGVSLEHTESFGAVVGDSDLNDMLVCTSNLDGEGASSHSCASKGGDGQDVGKHVDDY